MQHNKSAGAGIYLLLVNREMIQMINATTRAIIINPVHIPAWNISPTNSQEGRNTVMAANVIKAKWFLFIVFCFQTTMQKPYPRLIRLFLFDLKHFECFLIAFVVTALNKVKTRLPGVRI